MAGNSSVETEWVRVRRCAVAIALLMSSVGGSTAAGAAMVAVSPGASEQVVEAASACPTFTWAAVAGAVGYELVVVAVREAGDDTPVLRQRIRGAALAWTPPRARCLGPGEYAWVVRPLRQLALPAGAGSEGQPPAASTDWSAPLRFRVPMAPSSSELAAALDVLQRWQAAGGATDQVGAVVTGNGRQETGGGRDDRSAGGAASLAGAIAAVRADMPDTSGAAVGVLGVSHSPQGAGVLARNEAGGTSGSPACVSTPPPAARPAAWRAASRRRPEPASSSAPTSTFGVWPAAAVAAPCSPTGSSRGTPGPGRRPRRALEAQRRAASSRSQRAIFSASSSTAAASPPVIAPRCRRSASAAWPRASQLRASRQ